jgi:hypothetical protein
MVASNPQLPANKPLHHHVLESLEHIIDRFGMYMAIGAIMMMVGALITVG